MMLALLDLVPYFLAAGTVIYVTNRVFHADKYLQELKAVQARLNKLEARALSEDDYTYLMSSAARQNMP